MKTIDSMENSQKKTTWSIQDNKRTEAQRNAFKPTGKTVKTRAWKYSMAVTIVLLLLSYALVQMYQEPLQTCLTTHFCINSIDNPFAYTLFVFSNMAILILAFIGAYIGGSKLKTKLGF